MNKTFMQLAIKEAEKARGHCSPNPFVGAVIVKDGTVIAKGHTQSYGFDHAEVQALKQAGENARGADMYVTLEPCSHYGKTPPCALALIAAGIRQVYIGITDPNPLVSGKGIAMLKDAGIGVQQNILAEAINTQLESYLCYIKDNRPFVTLKTALSLDGKFAAEDGSSRWISNAKARQFTHKLRSLNDAVLTGIKTILVDNPLLNVRLPKNPPQPLRIVLDPLLQMPDDSNFAQGMREFPSLLFCKPELITSPHAEKLEAMGADIVGLALDAKGEFDLNELLSILAKRKITSLMLETGSGIAESFFKAELIDKCIFIYGAKLLGGTNSPLPNLQLNNISQAISLSKVRVKTLDDNIVVTAYPNW